MTSRFTVVGAGLAGSLMATYLARRGFEVNVYERRRDMRRETVERGRSINLALSTRGIHALSEIGIAETILSLAIPMQGRMVHWQDGKTRLFPYSTSKNEVIHSVSRQALNIALINEAEKYPSVKMRFHQKCTQVNLSHGVVQFVDHDSQKIEEVRDTIILGADGVHSAVREAMQKLDRYSYQQNYLEWGYKELNIPALPGGGFALFKNALHIWPRQDFMLIALPNLDGSFTCTLFLSLEGKSSFSSLTDPQQILQFFETQFPDALPHLPTLVDDFQHNPTSSLAYIRCQPWHHAENTVLIGDACHAVVPFYGQGMNAAFEDCSVLNACIEEYGPNWKHVFMQYEAKRKPNTDALADLSLQNFVEMRSSVASPQFLWHKKMIEWLHVIFPKQFIPLYSMVAFSRIPYGDAVQKNLKQERTIQAFGIAALIGLLILIALLF